MRTPSLRCAAFLSLLLITAVAADTIPKSERKPDARVDPAGDPLPPGAIAMLGNTRMRHDARLVAFVGNQSLVSFGNGLRTWDLNTGKSTSSSTSEVMNEFSACELSRDGSTLVIARLGHGFTVIDTRNGRTRRTFPGRLVVREHARADVVLLAVGADGKRFASCFDAMEAIHVYRTDSDKPPFKLELPAKMTATAITMTPDGSRVAATLEDIADNNPKPAIMAIWDVESGKRTQLAELKVGEIRNLAFSTDGKLLAVTGDSDIAVYATDAKQRWHKQLAAHAEHFAFAPDGRFVYLAGHEDENRTDVFVVDGATGEERAKWSIPSDLSASLTISPDSRLLASAIEGRLRVWKLADGSEAVPTGGHSTAICTTCITPDSKFVASTDFKDLDVFLWDVEAGREVRRFRGHTAGCIEIVFSADGKLLASSSYDATVRVWEVVTGKQLHQLGGFGVPQWHLRFTADGKALAMCPYRGVGITVVELATGNKLRELPMPGSFIPKALIRHPDGRLLVVDSSPEGQTEEGANSFTVQLWDLATGRVIHRLAGHTGQVVCANLSPDGRTLATRGDDGLFRLWELSTGEERGRVDEGGSIVSHGTQFFAWSPDGRSIASACLRENRVRLWDVPTGSRFASFDAHSQPMYTVEYTPDGKRLVTGSQDATLITWDMTLPTRASRRVAGSLGDALLHLHWGRLRDGTAAEAYQSIWALAGDPGQSVAFLADRFQLARTVSADQLRRWIVDLDSPKYAVRERAEKDLRSNLDAAVPELKRALEGTIGGEARKRIERMLETATIAVPSPDLLRELRSIEVLEQIGSPAVKEVLRTLATKGVHRRVALEAKSSLKRLESRPH